MPTRAKCAKCGDVIESTYNHHFVRCSCGECFVDGGDTCPRFGGEAEWRTYDKTWRDDEA